MTLDDLVSAWMRAVDQAERTNSDEDWVRADQLYRTWKRADLMARAKQEAR